jgi:acyl-CoA reductase-like NAD-dependent aldehyde dehydrogenase
VDAVRYPIPCAIGTALCENDIVRKLSFTGSTGVGRVLMQQCAPTIKKLSLELGGNAPLIVFDDADLDSAVAGIVGPKFRNAGQTCVCANRIYVQAGIHDTLVERLLNEVDAIPMGNGLELGVTQGPLIDERSLRCASTSTTRLRRARSCAPAARCCAGRHLLHPDRDDRRDAGDARGARRDLRPAGADLPLRD